MLANTGCCTYTGSSLSSSPSCHLPSPSPISLKIFPSPNLFSYSLSPLSFSHLPSLLPLFHRLSLSDLAICPVTLPSLAAGPSPSSVTCHHPLSSPLSLTFHLSHPHLTPSSLGLSQGERQSYAGLEAGLDRQIGWMGGLEKGTGTRASSHPSLCETTRQTGRERQREKWKTQREQLVW